MSFWRALTITLVPVVLLNSSTWGQMADTRAEQTSEPTLGTASAYDYPLSRGSLSGRASAPKPKQNDDDAKYELLPGEDPDNHLVVPFMKHLASDQRAFWMAPIHFRTKEIEWLAPLAGVTAGFMAGDRWISKQIPSGEIGSSKKISDYGVYSLVGAGAGSFVLGHLTGNDRMSETGLLSGEAAINSTAIAYFLKNITQRPRPFHANGSGTFFKGGDSFPSTHAAIAWSVASVLAHEYPGTLTKILSYGLATGVTATRVTGQQHFASDVVIGSALGWYFGRQVYRSHHDTSLGGGSWGDALPERSGEKTVNPENMGSPYVPLDSWIYPAIERLVALGYIKSAYLGIRPWTRMECARMLEEGEEEIGDADNPSDAAGQIYNALSRELSDERERLSGAPNSGAEVDTIYTRTTNVSGRPLRDGYHFGQTFINDYGRPYGQGFNAVAGVSAHATTGPISVAFRGEYQHSPAVASDPAGVLRQIANADFTLPVPNGYPATDQFRLLDSTVGITVHNLQLSFGKQTQWLGPTESGSLLFSNNAEPILMLKIDSVSPYQTPLLSKFLGPTRSEYFMGQLAGQEFEFNGLGGRLVGPGNVHPQPFLQGIKVSFRPTANFEFGMGMTAQFAGPGLPFTWHNFLRTFYSHVRGGNDPGKRLSSADFTYRVPGLRNWLTIYSDTLVVDEYSPIGSARATVNPGVYMPQVPKLSKLSIRAEGVHEPLTSEFVPGFVYYGIRRFRSGYTNDRYLLGNWIGRAGRGGEAWATYWLGPQSSLQFGYRLQEVSKDFIGGGRCLDYSGKAEVKLGRTVSLATTLQFEEWKFPALTSTKQRDLAASFQITFYPHLGQSK